MVKRRSHNRTNQHGTTFRVREHQFRTGDRQSDLSLTWRHGIAHINGSKTYQMPCPVCDTTVFYYRNEHGSRIFFDSLGKPWPLHGCMERAKGFLPLDFKKMVPVRKGQLRRKKGGSATNRDTQTGDVKTNSFHNAEMRFYRRKMDRLAKQRRAKEAEEQRLAELAAREADWKAQGQPMNERNKKDFIVEKKTSSKRKIFKERPTK